MSVLRYWIWLAALHGIGAKDRLRLLDEAGSPEEVYFTRAADMDRFPWLTPREKEALSDKRLDTAEKIIADCEEQNVHILTMEDAAYPERLRNIADPPAVLYIRGHLPALDDEPAVAMVGTRSCTPYGIKAAERIAYEYARAGGTVITGLAKGIDAAATRGALRGGGRVIGVLGNGTDVIYPRESAGLYEDVAHVGALVSEYPPGTPPSRQAFPVRNRLMSGLSVGVAIIEAPRKSGALITAGHALEQGRDVFVVPGNVDAEACTGSNDLLKEGAQVLTCGWDLAEAYLPLFPSKLSPRGIKAEVPLDEQQTKRLLRSAMPGKEKAPEPEKESVDNPQSTDYIDFVKPTVHLEGDERTVADAMSGPDMQVDDIIAGSGLAASKVLTALTLLEIKGYASQRSGKRFTLNVSLK